VQRSIQIILVVSLLCGLTGCFVPSYGPTYGYPSSGYSPYSYGWPVYAHGYAPEFTVHHPWEEHHAHGHPESFFHGPVGAPHPAGGPAGRFGGHPASGHAGAGGRGGHH
jgi:hypothetical protein